MKKIPFYFFVATGATPRLNAHVACIWEQENKFCAEIYAIIKEL